MQANGHPASQQEIRARLIRPVDILQQQIACSLLPRGPGQSVRAGRDVELVHRGSHLLPDKVLAHETGELTAGALAGDEDAPLPRHGDCFP